MKTDVMYKILVGTVFVLLITLVLYVGTNILNKQNQTSNIDGNNNEEIEVDNKTIEIYNEENNQNAEAKDNDRINVVAKYVDIYSECEHEISTTEQYYNSTLDTVKNVARDRHQEYSLAEESGNILVFERSYKGKCPNHFLVKIEGTNLNIYRVSSVGEYEIYQQTEIAAEFLREGLQQQLKEGMYVNSLSELFMLLEDVES